MMRISEEFISIQGEGKYVGVPSMFVRTLGCNLRCSWKNSDDTITICDTPYTSFYPENGYSLDYKKLEEKLKNSKLKHIVLTGGEPTMQSDFTEFLEYFINRGYIVTVETNGTKIIDWNRSEMKLIRRAFLSVSPKMKNSYNQKDNAMKNLHILGNSTLAAGIKKLVNSKFDYQLKFVVSEKRDLKDVLSLQKDFNISSNKIYLMPQGITNEVLFKTQIWLIKECIKHGFNFTPRLHINIWGNKRGI